MKKQLIKYKYTWRSQIDDSPTCSPTPSQSEHINTSPNFIQKHDQELIQEIQHAISIFVDENSVELLDDQPSLVDCINYSASYVKRVIKFCKRIQAFTTLKSDDQLIILKAFFREMLMIYFSFNFDLDKDGYPLMKVL